MLTGKIITIAGVSRLYDKGINICKGCEYERYAACGNDRVSVCNKQLEKYNNQKQ